MKRVLAIALAAAATIGGIAATPAIARDGCGPGFHSGPRGACRPNRMGGFYHGRGYWDGHRYWQNRYRYHGGWRYR